MITFLHTFEPSSILINFGPIAIHWYGFFMTLAIIMGFIVASFLFKQFGINKDQLLDIGFYLVLFGLLGARLAHVIVELPYYIKHPGEILAVWHGGLAIHGAIAMGLLVLYLYIKKHKQSLFPEYTELSQKFLRLADLAVIPLILGQAIGRWGNYFNQELYGRPTDITWGIPISLANRVPGFEGFQYFHPTFLYESLANLIIFLVLFYLVKNISHIKSNILKIPGMVFGLYLLSYSLVRFFTEMLRIDRMPIVADLRLASWVSIILIIVALWLMWYISRSKVEKI